MLTNLNNIGMPFFIYNAIDQSGRTKTGEIQAPDKAGAIASLKQLQLTPISLEIKGEQKKVAKGLSLSINFFQRISPLDKILLTKHLAAVVKAGLSMREALDILWEDAKKPILKEVLFDAKTSLERGQQLSSVFARYPRFFSPIFVGLVQAGEKSGTLEENLIKLGEQIFRDYDLQRKVKAALVYPAILFVASIGIVILLLTFLLPRLLKVFSATNVKLPLITRFFVAISDILSASPLITILVFIALIVSAFFTFRSVRGRKYITKFFQKIPITGEIIRDLALSRFTRTLNSLLKSGVGALEAIEISANSIGNEVYKENLLLIKEELKKGGSLASSFRTREKLFPRLLVSMIAVGERTGSLEKSLETLYVFYDEEVDRKLKNLVALLEPALLLVMGLVVGGVALSVILPIYSLVGGIR